MTALLKAFAMGVAAGLAWVASVLAMGVWLL